MVNFARAARSTIAVSDAVGVPCTVGRGDHDEDARKHQAGDKRCPTEALTDMVGLAPLLAWAARNMSRV
jgi:hypothetical protein